MGRCFRGTKNHRRRSQKAHEGGFERRAERKICQRLDSGISNRVQEISVAAEAWRAAFHRKGRGATTFVDALDAKTLSQRRAGIVLTIPKGLHHSTQGWAKRA